MALYHLSAKILKRSAGRSAIAAAAYRAALQLYDMRQEQTHDYRAKAHVVHSEVLLPDGAPVRLGDRSVLWNEVEAVELRLDAQLARDFEIALPEELSQAEAIALVRDFVVEQFVARGMIADVNVHWGRTAEGAPQPHAHVMVTMRSVGPRGFGPKCRDWNDTSLLLTWRRRWAEMANDRLCALGYDIRVDHRSNAERGIVLEPQNKIGPAGVRREARDEAAERAAEHRAIARRNGEQMLARPEIALELLAEQQSTWTRHDLMRLLHRHSDGADQFAAVLTRVLASPELVLLARDGAGQDRFTSRAMIKVEAQLERDALALAARVSHPVNPGMRLALQLGRREVQLGAEQQAALKHVTTGADVSAVVGLAGTGKSAMLGHARLAWEGAGYRVLGAALSGIAAEGLEGGSGIASRTIHSRLYAWAQGREALGPRDVLVVDEAGMLGSRMMSELLARVQAAGAKLVLVGDPEQLQAIAAGAAFRAIVERVGAARLETVRRQREEWQREATKELATGRTEAALRRYAAAGMVKASETLEDAKAALVASWAAERAARPGESRVMLASRRVDVADLNVLARERLRAAGELGLEVPIHTEQGKRQFASGDRLMFLRNERALGQVGPGTGVAVKNGTLGTVVAVEMGGRLRVRLDGVDGAKGRECSFETRDYPHVEHGYAATIHKTQGVTVDRAHVLATGAMDRHAAYVGLTRHRDGVAIHYAKQEFADLGQLAAVVGRERAKDTTLDYTSIKPVDLTERYAERRGLELKLPERATLKAQAQDLGRQWEQAMERHATALARLGGVDREIIESQEAMLQVGRVLREQPELAAMLQQEGVAWGLGKKSILLKAAADAEPERVVADVLAQTEDLMRAMMAKRQRQAPPASSARRPRPGDGAP